MDAIDAKKALIGGLIAIVLSPVSIILAYYLGQQLEKPKLSVTNIEQTFAEISPSGSDHLIIPDSIIGPLKGNVELQLIAELFPEDFESKMTKEDVIELQSSLGDARLNYEFTVKLVVGNINKINAWDGKSDLILEPINTQLLGGKSLFAIVKENKKDAINILRGIHSMAESRISDIKRFDNYVSHFVNEKVKKVRTGESVFTVGILNSGKTDAVIFPNGELEFKGKKIYFSAKNHNSPGYSVINSHSFKQIMFTLDQEQGDKRNIDEWKANIVNHLNESFVFSVNSVERKLSYSSHLKVK